MLARPPGRCRERCGQESAILHNLGNGDLTAFARMLRAMPLRILRSTRVRGAETTQLSSGVRPSPRNEEQMARTRAASRAMSDHPAPVNSSPGTESGTCTIAASRPGGIRAPRTLFSGLTGEAR